MKLADLSIRRPIFATMLIAALMVFGLVSYPRIATQLFPNVEFPVVTVTVVYPGADPQTLERKVADKIEQEVNTLGGVRALRSVNLEGATQVVVEFELEVDADQAVQDVRDRIGQIAGQLPEGAEPPVVAKFDIGAEPILTIALAGNLTPGDLTTLADKVVKERVQGISGVGSIDLIGGREREIHVLVDPSKLGGFGLTVQDVGQAIAVQSLDIPAGKFDSSSQELAVKTKGEVQSAEELANLFIPAARGGNVRLRDVALIVDDVEEPSSAAFLDGQPAVTLLVRKQSGANAVQVAEAIHRELEALRPRIEQAGARYTVPTDSSIYIKRSMHDVQLDLLFGALLAVLVIYFFLLDARATLISAIAIPTSVVSTFAFVYIMGFTFNNMTLLALSLAIGILVDDAIVVMENIHRHLEQGKPALQAASDATKEIFLAVVAMTSTIVAVFVPVALMKGIVGRFFLEFGLTVSFSVAASMLVSFTLTPMMSSRMLRVEKHRGLLGRAVDRMIGALEKVYGRVIRWALAHRAATVALAVGALAASAVLLTRVPMEFLPAEDRSEFQVTVELPNGSSLDTTTRVTEAVAKDLRDHGPGVVHTLSTVAGGMQGQSNQAQIHVKLTSPRERTFSQQQMMAWVRARYANNGTAQVTLEELGAIGGGHTQPIQLSIRGNDLNELVTASEAVKAELAKQPGFVDLDTTYRGGKPEVAIELDRERAASLGVPVAVVASVVRAMLAGDSVGELHADGDSHDIRIRLPKQDRVRLETLSNLKVRSSSGQLVDLSNVVHAERGVGPSRIDRQARQREVIVLAGLDALALGDAKKIVDEVAARVVPAHLTVENGGSAQIMEESFEHMVAALLLAVLLVYMILAVQFDSLWQPLTIMVSLPLSLIGAFGALAVSGMTLSIFSMIGVIMLMGLVTKNAILLVDFANQLRRQGKGIHEALVEAGMLRLRPILMTALSMVFGMLPVALAISEGGEVRAPMAASVIGGMITSTVLTLAVVPVVYSLIESATWGARLRALLNRKGARVGMQAPSVQLSPLSPIEK